MTANRPIPGGGPTGDPYDVPRKAKSGHYYISKDVSVKLEDDVAPGDGGYTEEYKKGYDSYQQKDRTMAGPPHDGWRDEKAKVEKQAADDIMAWYKNNPVDNINQPSHYTHGEIECIDYILDKGFDFCLGNVVKYVTRAGLKGQYVEDLKKAQKYLEFAIERAEGLR